MPAFRERCGSVLIEIHDVDHGPPHCHLSGLPGGRSRTVNLLRLAVRPPGMCLPRPVARCLRERQVVLPEAWDAVISADGSE